MAVVQLDIIPAREQYDNIEDWAQALTSALVELVESIQGGIGLPIYDSLGRLVVDSDGVYAYDSSGAAVIQPNNIQLSTLSYAPGSVDRAAIKDEAVTDGTTDTPVDTSFADTNEHTIATVNFTPSAVTSILEISGKMELDLITPASTTFTFRLKDNADRVIYEDAAVSVNDTDDWQGQVYAFNIPGVTSSQAFKMTVQMDSGASPDYDLADIQLTVREVFK